MMVKIMNDKTDWEKVIREIEYVNLVDQQKERELLEKIKEISYMSTLSVDEIISALYLISSRGKDGAKILSAFADIVDLGKIAREMFGETSNG